MQLGMAEKLMRTDPEAAAALLREARETTLAALADLRGVVRAFTRRCWPTPGWWAAIEALALPIPVAIAVDTDLPGHPPAAVESAVYFAGGRVPGQRVKHAQATQGAGSRLQHHDGALPWSSATTDEVAPTSGGSGLGGVARRLAAFDGTMVVSSPDGGPTVVTMEVPCELSSQRTRPSSATD